MARIELSYAPAVAIEKLRKAGVTTYAVFTQADLYEERIQREWGGDFVRALEEVLPDLHFALERTGSPYEYIAVVETERREGKSGKEEVLPVVNGKTGNLATLVRSIDEFLVKNKDAIAQHAKARAATKSEKPQLSPRKAAEEKATAERKTAEEKAAVAAEAKKRAGKEEAERKTTHKETTNK